MKSFLFILIFFFADQFVYSTPSDLLLLVDWHPEHEEDVSRHLETVYQKGRVKVLRLRSTTKQLPKVLEKVVRPIDLEDVSVYRPQKKSKEGEKRSIVDFISLAKRQTFSSGVKKLTSFENRGTSDLRRKEESGNYLARNWILSELKSLGYNAYLDCYREIGISKECNVVAELPGHSGNDDIILVQAHLDDVGHPEAGADDNASGSAALLAMAEAISSARFNKSIRLLFTNGEEAGLNGSTAYVKKLKMTGELSRVKFTINMDMVAYNKNSVFEIETNREFEQQANWYAELARTYTHLTPEITIPAWGSDHEVFLNEGIPSLLTIEDWQTKTPCYHRACDKYEMLNIEYAMEIVRLNLAAVAELAGLKN